MLAKSLQAAAGNAAAAIPYIEDVFSTYLYTGNGSTQTITNGIDLAGKGGLVWIKSRSGTTGHRLTDTVRGATKSLSTTSLNAQATESTGLTAFGATGFDIGADADYNTSAATYVAWGLREQPKFFDIVTWSGNDVSGRQISHSLGAAPGCMIIKATNQSGSWWIVYHRSLGATKYLQLSTTGASATSSATFNDTAPTDAVFTLGNSSHTNESGATYVAYLFAHNAGGFGLTGTDNVISCGSYTTDGSGNATLDLGYEPQWVILKHTSTTSGWTMFDTMRGWTNSSANDPFLSANTSNAENSSVYNFGHPTATGFEINNFAGSVTGIYIAIRRGPMKVPTTGTIVFSANATSAATGTAITTSFPVDLQVWSARASSLALNRSFIDRLRGAGTLTTDSNSPYLLSPSTAAEATDYGNTRAWSNTGFSIADVFGGINSIYWNFRRAPGFFDVVNSSVSPVKHNLGVVPELVITKYREDTQDWFVCGAFNSFGDSMSLNTTAVPSGLSIVTAPTATQFNSLATGGQYIYYIFASCPGVSKVGTYTGNGTTQAIACGFTAGARFVLIKRTDSTGNWYVWDSARGIVAGNDPHLSLNTTAAEVTTDDSVDTDSTGFVVNQVAATNVNVSSATYIFLAIA
jgi:hypothetical protein